MIKTKNSTVYPIDDIPRSPDIIKKKIKTRIDLSHVDLIYGDEKSTLSSNDKSNRINDEPLSVDSMENNSFKFSIDEEIARTEEDPTIHRQYWIVILSKIFLVSLFFGWMMFYIYYWLWKGRKEYIWLSLLIPIGIFFLLFPLTSFFNSIFNIFGSVGFLTKNSKYFCCHKKISYSSSLPSVTIQIPVYNEDFDSVLLPTFISVINARNAFMKEGGLCNIYVNDDGLNVVSQEEALKRTDYYDSNNFGYVGRSKDGRIGKFKKASNMNYCIKVSKFYENVLKKYREASFIRNIMEIKFSNILYDGNIILGDIILLLDSDSRIPINCLHETTQLFIMHEDLAFTQHMTTPLNITKNYWENFICHFTTIIYKYGILYATAGGDAPPLVGHNAFLRTSCLMEVYKDNNGKLWSENHVSEDFVLSMDLLGRGYNGKYCSFTGNEFLEGVSLNYIDEVIKFRKYSYGSSEILLNPFSDMFEKGFFNNVVRKYMKSDNIPSNSKFMLIGYLGTYFAMGIGVIMILINYIIIGYLPHLNFLLTTGMDIIIQSGLLFSLLVPIGSSLSQYKVTRTGLFKTLWYNIRYTFFYIFFFSSLNYQIFLSQFGHLIGSKTIGWGSTNKSNDKSGRIGEIKKTLRFFKGQFIYFSVITLLTLVNYYIKSPIQVTEIYAVFPLLLMCSCHLLPPFLLNPVIVFGK